jgi:peroxiredoxin Q/BCP
MALDIGDFAPDFTLLSDQHESISLSAQRGKNVVLYFYPKNNTPGCTREACDFRDTFTQLEQHNTVVFGISRDNPNSHQKFKQKHQLSFTLLADSNGDVCRAYDVIRKKSLFGNTFLGIQRATFLIDPAGKLRAIWRKVKVNGHSKQVLNEISGAE